MLTKVEVRTALGMLLVLPLEETVNGYIVEEILGLDPVKATLVSSSFAQLDGAQYQASRRETRNILLKIGLEPDYVTQSVEALRNNLYTFFMTKMAVTLRFFTSTGLIVDIPGRVETCETNLFTKEPQVDISIICFDPDFVDLTPVEILGDTVDDSTEFLIEYEGTVETGIVFVLNVDRALTEFTIYSRAADNVVRPLNISAVLQASDVVTINTVVGSKGLTLVRASTESSLLYAMDSQSNWTELQNGDNYFRIYAVGAPIPFSITYLTRYGGL